MFVLTATIKTLLCLMFLGISRQETPQYSYECKENGDIVLHGFSLNSFIQLVSVNNIDIIKYENCTKDTYSSDGFSHILIPKECMIGTNVTVDRTVVFRADDSVIDGATKPTPTPAPPKTLLPLPAPIPANGIKSGAGKKSATGAETTSATGAGTTSAAGAGTTSTIGAGTTSAAVAGTTSAIGTGTTSAAGAETTSAIGAGTTSAAGAGTTLAIGSTSFTGKTTGTEKNTIKQPTIPAANGTGEKGDMTLSYGQRYHYFRIECKVIPEGVVNHVIGHVGVKNVASLPNVFNSIGTVEMRFKSEEATNGVHLNDLPDVSTVYLGDKFYMYLKYIGQQDYLISPQKCTAYGDGGRAVVEKNTRNQKVKLWNYKDCVSDPSKRLHLMHTFKNLGDNIVYAEMFGFHFDIDADITIECDVKVCTKDSIDPTCEPSNCTNKDWMMVKRSTREDDNRMTVKGKLHVLEHQTGNSNSAGLVHFKWTVLVILQIMLYLY